MNENIMCCTVMVCTKGTILLIYYHTCYQKSRSLWNVICCSVSYALCNIIQIAWLNNKQLECMYNIIHATLQTAHDVNMFIWS